MLPKKYHAIIFISILVMLLLLGLHLLGIGYSGGQAAARTDALARNSSQSSSSSILNAALSQSQAYRHPIVYDKLTGATNNQINDVLGAKQPTNDYPIDHYQQQQQQQQQQQLQQQRLNQFNPNQMPQDDFFNNIHRQSPPGFPPHPLGPHHMHPPMGPPMVQIPSPLMTTPPPSGQQTRLGSMPLPQLPSSNQRQSNIDDKNGGNSQPLGDSLPSASSMLANNNARPSSNLTQHQHQQPNQPLQLAQLNQQLNQQNQPVYYTPPIFAYNNFDQNRQLTDPQLNQNLPYGFPQQQQQQQPPLSVPEAPMSIDEYNARQARLRQLNQQLQPTLNEVSQSDRYGKPQLPQRLDSPIIDPQYSVTSAAVPQRSQNLLADPQQQQRHKHQMLDGQLLFGHQNQPGSPFLQTPDGNSNPNSTHLTYPDPALLYRPPMLNLNSQAANNNIRPPYAHNMPQAGVNSAELDHLNQIGKPQNRILPPSNRVDPTQQQPPNKLIPAPVSDRQLGPNLSKINTAGVASNLSPVGPNDNSISVNRISIPACAARQATNELNVRNLELINSTNQMPPMLCNEDPDYPTKDIMRALEAYATERSIEQLLPQLLVQIQMAQRGPTEGGSNRNVLGDIQRQLTLDSLQPSISPFKQPESNGQLVSFDEQRQPVLGQQPQQQMQFLFPSANYEPLCRSTTYMAQPRRAKNLLGQWKIVVNLPGHKYRGIAVSQMVRIEECSRPNSECAGPNMNNAHSRSSSNSQSNQSSVLLPKSRCLQNYENQRLVAWSHQQGLHLDIFRVPIAYHYGRTAYQLLSSPLLIQPGLLVDQTSSLPGSRPSHMLSYQPFIHPRLARTNIRRP